MEFEITSKIVNIELIAKGHGIRDLTRLNKTYGRGNWRKLKGHANIRLKNGIMRVAEVHWYEAHGIGKVEMKRKRYV